MLKTWAFLCQELILRCINYYLGIFMDFMSLLPWIGNIVFPVLASVATKYLPIALNNRYYKIAAKLYPLVDATLADNIAPYGESGVRKIISELVYVVEDGHISPMEVSKAVDLFLKEFNLAKAASTPVNDDALLVLNAVKTATSVDEIDLRGLTFSFK